MGRVATELDESWAAFITHQQMFFVATAPLEADGHVNLSPKGLDSFTILDAQHVAWLDLAGSGIETVAHLQQNGRIVIMFCAFEGPHLVVRLYGRGEVIERSHPDFASLCARFEHSAGARSVIRVTLDRVADSCGMGVPRYAFQSQRDELPTLFASGSPEKLSAFIAKRNGASIDGLPGLPGLSPS
ncbi:pyridoxamine 5'-phosphate oxidase family protein [bacterium]|nr:MAG: pyridoxamine 5'-phosphate oxidase family protein [bacterium]